jgi:phosphoribosylaminoimidazole-succinocarboxamide synthase
LNEELALKHVLYDTVFPNLDLVKQGKVRDIYDLGDSLLMVADSLLMVATDRISAFDVILPNPIPDKGRILTHMSRFWFQQTKSIVANHLISTDVNTFPATCQQYQDVLTGRSMRVHKAEPLPVECIVRGYISGSGWKSYQESGNICGIALPKGLTESDRLPEPIFTPSTKEEVGTHDENITIRQVEDLVGKDVSRKLQELSISIYKRGVEIAEARGIIIADTKFEFGLMNGQLVLIDEILTPDSSRFWPKNTYRPGGPQKSFDKQYVRDHLLALKWDQKPPAPLLPDDVVENTRMKYEEALHRLTDNGGSGTKPFGQA